jgi:hypothetical protein
VLARLGVLVSSTGCDDALKTAFARTAQSAEPIFAEAFTRAKARVRAMDLRFVEEENPLRQALLEIYVSIALGTKYNDFDTH